VFYEETNYETRKLAWRVWKDERCGKILIALSTVASVIFSSIESFDRRNQQVLKVLIEDILNY